jgi:hypothetical protein
MIGAFRRNKIGMLLGQLKCLRARVVVEVTGRGHAVEPFLDVSWLQARR